MNSHCIAKLRRKKTNTHPFDRIPFINKTNKQKFVTLDNNILQQKPQPEQQNY